MRSKIAKQPVKPIWWFEIIWETSWIKYIHNFFERPSIELDSLEYHKISKVYRFLAKKGVKFRKLRKYTKIISTNLQ